ncbi:TPA: (2Fe-2S)-binding protein, partial [Klebsiella quasipneumoniae]|nr:(2Fe-2S)-binding protein [Klebsiella quasipneumoniae]
AIGEAIASGCASVGALGTRLKCGTNCGSCVPELNALLATQPARAGA